MSSSEDTGARSSVLAASRGVLAASPKLRTLLIAVIVSATLDQIGKILVTTTISHAERVSIVDGFFYLTHVRNPGAAFGLFADAAPNLRKFVFFAVSGLSVVVVISFFRALAPGDRRSALALGFILGGAIGNFIDRALRDEVVDFLQLRLWGGYAWPDFNLADLFIVMGVGTLMLELLASEGISRADPSGDP